MLARLVEDGLVDVRPGIARPPARGEHFVRAEARAATLTASTDTAPRRPGRKREAVPSPGLNAGRRGSRRGAPKLLVVTPPVRAPRRPRRGAGPGDPPRRPVRVPPLLRSGSSRRSQQGLSSSRMPTGAKSRRAGRSPTRSRAPASLPVPFRLPLEDRRAAIAALGSSPARAACAMLIPGVRRARPGCERLRGGSPSRAPTGSPVGAPRSSRAHAASSCASADVSPRSGAVRTSSVGAGRALGPFVAGLVEGVVDPRQRPRAGVGVDRLELPVRVGAAPGERSKRRNGSPAGSPSRRGRCSLASPPSRWPTPDRSLGQARAGARRRWTKGSAVCRRSSGSEPVRRPAPLRRARRRAAEQRDDAVDVDHQQGLGRRSIVMLARSVFS